MIISGLYLLSNLKLAKSKFSSVDKTEVKMKKSVDKGFNIYYIQNINGSYEKRVSLISIKSMRGSFGME